MNLPRWMIQLLLDFGFFVLAAARLIRSPRAAMLGRYIVLRYAISPTTHPVSQEKGV